MKQSMISKVLDLAYSARQEKRTFNPLFSGHAGVGKSEIVQQWVKEKQKTNPKFGFLDLRIAYYEAPDIRGFPTNIEINGKSRQINSLPDFWPTEGEGLLLLEEVGRGTTGVMNTLMQLLTDRCVGHDYKLPEGWFIASCNNPESSSYDTNHMDSALLNRFEVFDVEYDPLVFMDYMNQANYSETVQMYVGSGSWIYKNPDQTPEGETYVSPRTWSKINNAEVAGAKEDMQLHFLICTSILGKTLGNEYWSFCHKDQPVTANDVIKDVDKALKKLKKLCDPLNYRGDMISITVESIIKHYGGLKPEEGQVGEEDMVKVAQVIMSDHALNLVKDCMIHLNGKSKKSMEGLLAEFVKRNPTFFDTIKDNVKLDKHTSTPQKRY